MKTRLPEKSTEIIDRRKPLTVFYRKQAVEAFDGDTAASALHGAGIRMMSRSFKYHRPRGIMDLGVHSAAPTMRVDGRINDRICRTPAREGMKIEPESRMEGDVFSLADPLSWMMPTGFYYKALYKPKWLWKKSIPVLRNAPGNIGEIRPLEKLARFDKTTLTPELLVVGGGLAGLQAAVTGAGAGVRVILVEAEPWLGGFERFQGEESLERIRSLCVQAERYSNLEILTHTTAAAVYPDGLICCVRFCGPDDPFLETSYLIRPKAVVVATGAMDRPLLFNNNDRPGVMFPQTVQRLVHLYALKPGERILVAGGDDSIYKTALDLARNGAEIAGIADSRRERPPEGIVSALAGLGVPLLFGHTVVEALGKKGVEGARVGKIDGSAFDTFFVDTIVAACGRTPLFKLLAQAGARIEYDPVLGFHRVKKLPPGFHAAGRVTGLVEKEAVQLQGGLAASAALAELGIDAGFDAKAAEEELSRAVTPSNPVQNGPIGRKNRRFICFSNDVTEKDLDAALSEGFDHIEMIKRYTTATMGPDQGAISMANFLDYAARKMPQKLGTQRITTPRPPLVGLSMGALSAGLHDQPRLSPIHRIQLEQGGKSVRTGPWIRIEHFGDPEQENLAVRNAAGICDVSTLGKFRIFGPDAEKLLNRVNTKGVGTLENGRILYTAACNEEGVFIDDGIVIKRGADDYYFTTSTARGPVTVEWYSRWCREENWTLWMVNLTDARAGMNLAGPRSREILAPLTAADISNEALPYMHWVETEIAGVRSLIFRMGFLGELSYEIHCPASVGAYLWSRIVEAGAPAGLKAVGLESQLTCRLEKGHILPGLDSDGNTTLFEAQMDWLWDRKKEDTVGGPMLRLLEGKPLGNRVIGFAMDGRTGLQEGNLVVEGPERLGYITSVRYSRSLDQTLGLALVKERPYWKEGGVAKLSSQGKELTARVVKPPFYDPKGERLRR